MVMGFIVSEVLEVGVGTVWWLVKKTVSGAYYGTKYLIYGSEDETPSLTQKELQEKLEKQEELLKKILENLDPSEYPLDSN